MQVEIEDFDTESLPTAEEDREALASVANSADNSHDNNSAAAGVEAGGGGGRGGSKKGDKNSYWV